MRVDREVVDDRLHREGQRVLAACAWRALISSWSCACASALRAGANRKRHPAARHAAEHPEAPEVIAKRGAGLLDQRLGVEIAGPGDDRLERPEEVARGRRAHAAISPSRSAARIASKISAGILAGLPTRPRSAADISRSPSPGSGRRSGPCRRAPAPGSPASAGGSAPDASRCSRMRWLGSRRPRLMPHSGSPSLGRHALDQLDRRPDAAGILPAAARAGQPLAQNRARRHQSPLVLGQRPGQRGGLAGGAHADARSGRPAGWSKPPGASPWGCR